MTRRIDRTWLVFDSVENEQHDRCVDFFKRPDGTFGFEEFRRDPEDAGAWTPVRYYSDAVYDSEARSQDAATAVVAWLEKASEGK